MNEQEMIKRYIYEVIRRVPEDSREDIRLELQTLIEDMCTEEQISVQEALQKLGAPEEFAKRYRGDGEYLIGPEYYNNYLWVIKIALAGIGISALISGIVQGISHADSIVHFFVSFFNELLSTGISGSFCVAGIITIIFAVLERQHVKLQLAPEKDWSVKDLGKNSSPGRQWTPFQLPPVPDKRAVISRCDSIVSIIMISIFSALLLFKPQLFGVFHYENGQIQAVASVFNLDQWQMILPVFLLWLFTGLIDEIIRFVTGHYCRTVMYCNLICNTLQIALAAVLLKVLPLWNTDFAAQLKQAYGISQFSKGDILHYWESSFVSNAVLCLIIIISLAESGVTVYKTLKYSKQPV